MNILIRGYINGSSQPLEGFNRDGHGDLSSYDSSFLSSFVSYWQVLMHDFEITMTEQKMRNSKRNAVIILVADFTNDVLLELMFIVLAFKEINNLW